MSNEVQRFRRLDNLAPVRPEILLWGVDARQVTVKRSFLSRREAPGLVPYLPVSARWAVRLVPESPLDARAATIAYIVARDGCCECLYCGDELDPAAREPDPRACTIEHVVASGHGGPDHAVNLAIACSTCNAAVGHMSAAEKFRYGLRRRKEVA